MNLLCETPFLEDYLREDEIIDSSHPLLQATARQLSTDADTEMERVRKTFEFVRDIVHHSCDIQNPRVTCQASDVLSYGVGLCYAKSHLLAALLRAQGTPAGFCYQRVTLAETAEQGYVIHGLNAIYLKSLGQWIRLDARGNKPGIQAEFSPGDERIAFATRPEFDEIDYPTIFVQPHPKIVQALREQSDALNICLPDQL